MQTTIPYCHPQPHLNLDPFQIPDPLPPNPLSVGHSPMTHFSFLPKITIYPSIDAASQHPLHWHPTTRTGLTPQPSPKLRTPISLVSVLLLYVCLFSVGLYFCYGRVSDSPHVTEPTTPCLSNYLPHFYMYVQVRVFYIAMAVFSDNTINQGFPPSKQCCREADPGTSRDDVHNAHP